METSPYFIKSTKEKMGSICSKAPINVKQFSIKLGGINFGFWSRISYYKPYYSTKISWWKIDVLFVLFKKRFHFNYRYMKSDNWRRW